jgi:NAD+ kinase
VERRFRTVGLVVTRGRRRAIRAAGEIVAELRHRRVTVLGDEAAAPLGIPTCPRAQLARSVDLLVVLGGDGTLLSVARHAPTRVPILGVNMGELGFLTEVTGEEALAMLRRVLAGEGQLDRRMTATAKLERGGRVVRRFRVLNDVVVSNGALARLVRLEVEVDGQPMAAYRADGLIVATPTGSTAYSLSAGGPIIDPSVRALLVSPISPHTLSQRPVVLPPTAVVRILVPAGQRDVVLTADGQEGAALEPGDAVTVRLGRAVVSLVRSSDRTYYEVLRSKLGWGV